MTDFTAKEMKRLNGTANLLDKVTRQRARSAGLHYVDPRAAFDGHALCDGSPWINNVVFPIEESFHPMIAGQAAFAGLVAGHL